MDIKMKGLLLLVTCVFSFGCNDRQDSSLAASQVADQSAGVNETVLMTNAFMPLGRHPMEPLKASVAQTLSIRQIDSLIQMCRASTNPEQKIAIIWTLGLAGTSNATAELIAQVTNQYVGKWFTAGAIDGGSDEEQVFFIAVSALGFAGAHDDNAYAFLKRGLDADFWTRTISWQSKRGDGTHDLLTAMAISAIGMTGRPDVPSILQDLKPRCEPSASLVLVPRRRNNAGSVTQAAFYNWVIQKYGAAHLRENFFGEARDPLRQEWKESEEGKKWSAWYRMANGLTNEGRVQ